MGVSVEGSGPRGRRSGLVELNLVPFIDLLSCLIAFLMVAAVWTQITTLDVQQNVAEGWDGPPPEGPPPLTVHLRSDGLWVARNVEQGIQVPAVDGGPDLARLDALLQADHAAFPAEDLVIVNTDDGVPYEAMMHVLDLTRERGYPRTLLAGGPAEMSVDPG
jgi:biopolymer transport protein ExbD